MKMILTAMLLVLAVCVADCSAGFGQRRAFNQGFRQGQRAANRQNAFNNGFAAGAAAANRNARLNGLNCH